MPDDAKKNILSSMPLSGALALITALAGALLLNYEPLIPRRPAEPSAPSVVPGDSHKFDAAPGDDPLRALSRAKLVSPDRKEFNPSSDVEFHTPWGFFIELRERLKLVAVRDARLHPAKQSRVLLMPVLLRPGSDMASTEQRSRARAAVTAGLTSSGYVPEHGGSLECCHLSPWPLTAIKKESPPSVVPAIGEPLAAPVSAAHPSSALDVAFEWFKSSPRIPAVKNPAYESVGVLWLRGDALGSKPLSQLRTTLHRMLHGHPRKSGSEKTDELDAERLDIVLLGPHSTDNLAAFIAEAADKPEWREDQWAGALRMISPWATASARALLRISETGLPQIADDAKRAQAAEKRVDEIMEHVLDPGGVHPQPFIRSLTTDDHVANALVDELERRGLTLRKTSSTDIHYGNVAIISEFDTSYGRELPLTFMEAMTGQDMKGDFNRPKFRWHWINYPRGLDGRYSSDSASGYTDKSSSSAKGDAKFSPDELPTGVNQADALRRLAAQLEELDQNLTRRGGAGLVAVGVLGGDVYDKLWILRALRPRLPLTQFFTNNLDSWLWQRDELRTTRNLIVGSPYGITLANPWQMGKLPFRDSYQTSVYAAALGATGAVDVAQFDALRSPAAVRLFEIGRTEPYDLSLASPQVELHPQEELHTWWQLGERSRWALWIGLILITAWLGWMIVSWLPGLGLIFGRHRMTMDWKLLLPKVAKSPATVFGIVIFVTWRIESWWSVQQDGGEPLLFGSGISAWPAQGFRLAAVLITFYLILKACALLADSTRQLRMHYFPEEPGESASLGWRSPLDWLKSMFLFWKTSAVLTARQGEESIVHPRQLWSEYRFSNSITARITRSVVVAGMLYAGASLLLHLLGNTLSPVRGFQAREIDLWLDRASLAALLWLAAFVVDTLWLNRVFIQWFSRGKSDWQMEMLRPYRKSKLHADNLRDFIDLQMVADWTRDVGRLTFFPFYVLALLILARVNRFDAWNWPSALIIIYFLVVVLVIVGAARVRSAAENLRSKAVDDVRKRYSALEDDSAAAKLLKEIHSLSRGAFVPFSEQPVMKALYWLLGALGVGGLWQALAQWL